jgi:hypothetical protein
MCRLFFLKGNSAHFTSGGSVMHNVWSLGFCWRECVKKSIIQCPPSLFSLDHVSWHSWRYGGGRQNKNELRLQQLICGSADERSRSKKRGSSSCACVRSASPPCCCLFYREIYQIIFITITNNNSRFYYVSSKLDQVLLLLLLTNKLLLLK